MKKRVFPIGSCFKGNAREYAAVMKKIMAGQACACRAVPVKFLGSCGPQNKTGRSCVPLHHGTPYGLIQQATGIYTPPLWR